MAYVCSVILLPFVSSICRVEVLWFYTVRFDVNDYGNSPIGYVDAPIFSTASSTLGYFTTDSIGIIRSSWQDGGYYDLSKSMPSLQKDAVFDSFLNQCKPSSCNWIEDAAPIDIVMNCIAVLGKKHLAVKCLVELFWPGSAWSILTVIGGLAYAAIWNFQKKEENDTDMTMIRSWSHYYDFIIHSTRTKISLSTY